ncbi:MAG TPA: hypothetical protein VFN49_09815 [Candidatus Aquilonibacter sp.]|nr:hypothetical protein [Candidatus Aquilonibacter sp.]
MRRTFGMFLLCLSFGLLAVAPAPAPKPKAAPTPKATFAPTAVPTVAGVTPTVIIYPFQTPTDLDPKMGTAIAQIYEQVLTQAGGLKVLPIPEKIKREDWTKYAHAQHADYYISGFVQPIGNIAAIVARIVDVNSEIAVYSQTTQVQNVPDVASQALTADTVIKQAAGIDRPQSVVSTSTKATPTPSSSEGASYNVSNVLGGLFKRGAKGPAATAPATPAPAKPPISMIVAHLTGNASAADLNRSTDDLFRAMNAYYKASMSSVHPTNLAKQADSICGTNRSNTIASGVLDAKHVGGLHAHNAYTFTLRVYTCFGAVLYSNTQTNDDKEKAVKEAVDAYQDAHPDNT